MNLFNEVNKHLMMQLDRLTSIQDEDLQKDLEHEANRAKAICEVVKQAVAVGQVVVKAHEVSAEYNISEDKLGIGNKK